MRFEEKEVPRNHNIGMREMLDDEDADDDIVELNWEDVEQMEEWSQQNPSSSDDEDPEDKEQVLDDDQDMTPAVDDAALVLSGHTGSVFCCAFHPSESIAVTGGEDDKAILWKVPSNQPVSVLSHYKDSVSEVGFSFDGKFIAVADMMGNIEVYSINSQDLSFTKVWSERIEEVQWMEWHGQAHVLLAGGLGTSVYLWKIPSGECKVLSGECSSQAGTFMHDGRRAVVAYRNGGVRIFNLMNGDTICSFKEKDWRLDEIISLAIHPNNNLAVVGDTVGNIALFTTQSPGKVVKEYNFSGGDGESAESSCIENLMFCKDSDLSALLVTTSRGLYIWDYVRQAVRRYVGVSGGVTKMICVGESDIVAIGTSCGPVYLVDIRQGTLVKVLTGHSDAVLSLAVTRDCKNLLTTSDDTSIRLFSLTDHLEVS